MIDRSSPILTVMHWTETLGRGPRRIRAGGCDLEVLHWDYDAHLRDNVLHRHAYYEVCLVGDYGRGQFTARGEKNCLEKHGIGAGDLFFARPGVLHQIENTARPHMELFWVSFIVAPHQNSLQQNSLQQNSLHQNSSSTLAASDEGRAVFAAFSDSPLVVAPDSGGRVRALWQALSTLTLESGKAGYAAQIEGVAGALLLAIAQAGAGNAAPPGAAFSRADSSGGLAQLAIRYIHDNLDRRLPVEEIAAHVHVSPRHLSRLMSEFTGIAPASYIERARLERAKVLLREGDLPAKVIAARVGYADVQSFTRAFTRNFRAAPVAFRKSGAASTPVYQSGDLV